MGNQVGSLEGHQFGTHSHTLQGFNGSTSGGSPAATLGLWTGGTLTTLTDPTTPAGGSETRPINANVNYIIKS
jgi:hypothetical protein